jgi:hypothetical protein
MNLCVMEKTVNCHYRINKKLNPIVRRPYAGQVKPLRLRMVTISKLSPDIKAAIHLIVSTNVLALSGLLKNISDLF